MKRCRRRKIHVRKIHRGYGGEEGGKGVTNIYGGKDGIGKGKRRSKQGRKEVEKTRCYGGKKKANL